MAPPLENKGFAVVDIQGMWCSSCAHAVESFLNRQKGVLEATVSFVNEAAVIRWQPDKVDPNVLFDAIKSLGYEPRQASANHIIPDSFDAEVRSLQIRLAVAVVFSIWVMMLSLVIYWDTQQFLSQDERFTIVVFTGLFATPVIFYSGIRFYIAGLRTLYARVPGMDSLISIGVIGAFFLSLYSILNQHDAVYFDTACMLITLLLAGRLIDMQIKKSAREAIYQLLDYCPERITYFKDNNEHTILLSDIAPGDLVRIKAGERIAIDGIIERGTADIDNTILTGESQAVTIHKGEKVNAGMLNLNGDLIVKVTSKPNQRRIDQLAQNVKQITARHSDLHTLSHRFARFLFPSVILLAAISGFVIYMGSFNLSDTLVRSISILVITCPCAIGLAIPLASLIFTKRMSKSGFVINNPNVIEALASIDTVIFDKTGTLTSGRPVLIEAKPNTGTTSSKLYLTAATACVGSHHPLAQIITEQNNGDLKKTESIKEYPGQGIKCITENKETILVGKADFLKQHDIDININEITHASTVMVALDQHYLGYFVFQYKAISEAEKVISVLREKMYTIYMLSGDTLDSATEIARDIGLKLVEIIADSEPEDKTQVIEQLQKTGHSVMYIGDGLNDAPALAKADIGIAVNNATDVAKSAADIILTESDLKNILNLLELGKPCLSIMKQNLFGSFIYNFLAIPAAVLGFVHPLLAVIAMILSSLTVTINSLRLSKNIAG